MMTRRELLRNIAIVGGGISTGIAATVPHEALGAAGNYCATPSPEACRITGDVWLRAVFDVVSEETKFYISADGDDWVQQDDAPFEIEISETQNDLDLRCQVGVDDWDNIGEDIEIISKHDSYRLYLPGDGGFSSQARVKKVMEFDADGNLVMGFNLADTEPGPLVFQDAKL